jgi:hypothetical protein
VKLSLIILVERPPELSSPPPDEPLTVSPRWCPGAPRGGADADDNAGDRSYLVLAKPNVIMNQIRLRGLAVARSHTPLVRARLPGSKDQRALNRAGLCWLRSGYPRVSTASSRVSISRGVSPMRTAEVRAQYSGPHFAAARSRGVNRVQAWMLTGPNVRQPDTSVCACLAERRHQLELTVCHG